MTTMAQAVYSLRDSELCDELTYHRFAVRQRATPREHAYGEFLERELKRRERIDADALKSKLWSGVGHLRLKGEQE